MKANGHRCLWNLKNIHTLVRRNNGFGNIRSFLKSDEELPESSKDFGSSDKTNASFDDDNGKS